MRQFAVLLLFCSVMLFPLPTDAQSPEQFSSEQALLIEHPDRIELILGFTRAAVASNTGILVLAPSAPTASIFTDGAHLFAYLAEATRPAKDIKTRYVIGLPPLDPPAPTALPAPPAAPPAASARLVTYAAGDPVALPDWLTTHRVPLSVAEQAVLEAHLAAGGGLVLLVAPDAALAHSLIAVRISYATAAPGYPAVLGAAPGALDLYVLADGRRTASSFATYYAAPTTQLDPAPPAALRQLIASDAYLTHLHSAETTPSGFGTIAVEHAASNAPLRRTAVVQEDRYLLQRFSTAIGLGLVACASLLALVGAVALRRRLDAISPDA
jgi:hypothetical protein